MSSENPSYFLNSVTQSLSNNTASPVSNSNSQVSSNHATGTTSIPFMDELVKEYLLFRGFNSTLKYFDYDVKQDRDRCFKPDKITDQLLAFIYSYDLSGLMDYWSYLDHKYFSRLTIKISNYSHNTLTKRYELNLLRLYLVNTLRAYKTDKAYEFFENYVSKLQSQAEWKEWYCLPFLKTPEENPTFSIYFSQNWIDAFIVSLQNFLNIVFQSLPFPRLINYEEDAFWNKNSNKKIVLNNVKKFFLIKT